MKLQYNITSIFDIISSNRMFRSMHNFISKTLKMQKTLVTFSLTLILKVRILDIPKLFRYVKAYLITFEKCGETRKIKIHM